MSAGLRRPMAPGQMAHESPADFLRRVVSNINMETESLLDDLPSVEAVLEYLALWHTYDTDFLQGIEESILEGDDPKPYYDFLEKYGLDWEKFKKTEEVPS